jgi:outer membrane protein assembly factor BamB
MPARISALGRALFRRGVAAALTLSCTALAVAADGDWPQWRGPDRDGHAAPQLLLQKWPSGGPEVAWVFRDAGEGYSAFSIVDGRLYTMGARDGKCYAICLSSEDGSEIWRTEISVAGQRDDYLTRWGGGPRSTPTVDGDFVYVLSDVGVVACLKKEDGEEVWSKDLVEQYGAQIPKWGYSESILIDGFRAVVTPGGDPYIVGLNKRTGEEIYRTDGVDTRAEYVSVIKFEVGGQPLYASAAAPGLFIFNAEGGDLVYEAPETGNGTAVIPTPVVTENLVYHTSAYGAGNALYRLSGSGSSIEGELVYYNGNKSMENHHGGVVLVDGVIYGFTKTNRGNWMAQDFKSGEELWMESIGRNSSGSIAYADGRLYCYGDKDATVHLIEPSRSGMKVVGSATLPEQTDMDRGSGAIWAHPVIAGQKLFLRDQNLIYAYDIAR